MLVLMMAAISFGCNTAHKVSDKDMQLADFDIVQELNTRKDTRTVMIDVRSQRLFQKEHIKDAFHIYLPHLKKRDRLLAGDPMIIVYSSGEVHDLLATAACKKLLDLGYVNVYNYRGGLKDWIKNGGETAVVEFDIPKTTEDYSAENQ
ncbi:rhodanese-like domain-containing protein [Poriferisphaera sp. WC338]|uniref:rhodanese-like domain-containing protein n=1 Tax=Poriferisphaera sp. WC338 TaxID=3425129 RepID=UPI003D81ACD7